MCNQTERGFSLVPTIYLDPLSITPSLTTAAMLQKKLSGNIERSLRIEGGINVTEKKDTRKYYTILLVGLAILAVLGYFFGKD